MPRVIELADDAVIGLAECTDAMASRGFDPADEDSLAHAALMLRRLGNDAQFLGDMVVAELARGNRDLQTDNSYGPEVIMLARPDTGKCFLRANIWPSPGEHMMRASGSEAFVYGLPHDHNFNFLTLGYFGPGYWSDYYEFDYEDVHGWQGETAGLRFASRERLEPGRLMLYRAHRDVHAQGPADALSVSLNIMHTGTGQGWLDQYQFDVERDQVAKILTPGSSETFLRIAVGLGGAEALDLAHRFARHHPSDRMRLHAWDALASVALDDPARDDLWRGAEGAGSLMVAMEAKARRAGLRA